MISKNDLKMDRYLSKHWGMISQSTLRVGGYFLNCQSMTSQADRYLSKRWGMISQSMIAQSGQIFITCKASEHDLSLCKDLSKWASTWTRNESMEKPKILNTEEQEHYILHFCCHINQIFIIPFCMLLINNMTCKL